MWQEQRHPLPIVELGLFRNRNVGAIMCMNFFIGAQMLAGFSFLPLYFQSVLGDTALMSVARAARAPWLRACIAGGCLRCHKRCAC